MAIAIHIPMRKGAIGWVAEQDDELDLSMVVANALYRRPPVSINWRAGADDLGTRFHLYVFVQNVVADVSGEALFIVKEMTARMIDHMRLLAVRHGDMRVLVEMIMQRTRPAFLGPSDEEIQLLNLSCSWPKHDHGLTPKLPDLGPKNNLLSPMRLA